MSERLPDLLAGNLTPDVYRLASRARVATLSRRAAAAGWTLFHLDGSPISTKADFLRSISQAMGFPAYFGRNWDALEECLADLDLAPAGRGVLLLYDRSGRWARAEPQAFAVALDILRGAVVSRRASAIPLAVLLRGLGRYSPSLPIV